MKYSISAKVVGSKYLGEVEADSEEDAIQKGYSLGTTYISICHECSSQCEDAEVDEITATPI